MLSCLQGQHRLNSDIRYSNHENVPDICNAGWQTGYNQTYWLPLLLSDSRTVNLPKSLLSLAILQKGSYVIQ